jgi:hypothetical protein
LTNCSAKKSDNHPDIATELYTKAIIDLQPFRKAGGRHRRDRDTIVALPPLGGQDDDGKEGSKEEAELEAEGRPLNVRFRSGGSDLRSRLSLTMKIARYAPTISEGVAPAKVYPIAIID